MLFHRGLGLVGRHMRRSGDCREPAAPRRFATETSMTNLLHSDISPTQIRQELLDAGRNDLLGPVEGEVEEIDERSVQDRYLVGMLAPRRQEIAPEEFDELA